MTDDDDPNHDVPRMMVEVYADVDGLDITVTGCDCTMRDPRMQMIYVEAMLGTLSALHAKLTADGN